MKKKYLAMLLLALMAIGIATAQSPAKSGRVALVIGNSAYTNNPLANPKNDAMDMGAALKNAGFEVILKTDADLVGMEKAIDEFVKLLRGKDTALLYYAGHGVQIESENYLIPIKEEINSAAQARSRSVSVNYVLDKIKTSGVTTALIFLDACRDNPFPGSSRSGTRGLGVVAIPPEVETCVAYATQPGNVAQDGQGRNGLFTAAMLKFISDPGISLGDLMTKVMAEVKTVSGGKQLPRVDNGLTSTFYFVDPALAAERAKTELEKSRKELASLDASLLDLQRRIAESRDAQAKTALELEQQKQQALKKAKALEAEYLAREAARKQADADEAAKFAQARAAAQAEREKAQAETARLAAARRAELDKLSKDSASDNPDVLIETVERLAAVLTEVDTQYDLSLAEANQSCNERWNKQLYSLNSQTPDITESDAEFAERIKKEKAALEQKRQAELVSIKSKTEAERQTQAGAIRRQYENALRTLLGKTWTVTGKDAVLTVGAFDRNAKTWTFTIDSADPGICMTTPMELIARLGDAANPAAAIRELDTAVKANALAAEIVWGLNRIRPGYYRIEVRTLQVRNLTSNSVPARTNVNFAAGYFYAGSRKKIVYQVGDIGPSGGWVFYDKGNYIDGWRYLEAAPEDIDKLKWTNDVSSGIDATYKSGKSNTGNIITSQKKGNYAASACAAYQDGIWFLPSKEELDKMYQNLSQKGLGQFKKARYWTSSSNDYSGKNAFYLDFTDGTSGFGSSSQTCYVRAIRSFTPLTVEAQAARVQEIRKALSPAQYNVGDEGPGGGWIFYDKGNYSDGWRYLVAGPTDLGKIQWYNGRELDGNKYSWSLGVDGKTRTSGGEMKSKSVGSGQANTNAIISCAAPSAAPYAARACTDYQTSTDINWFFPEFLAENLGRDTLSKSISNNFSRWFLPTLGELELMYMNLKKRSLGNFKDLWYWSSTQGASDSAWAQYFSTGKTGSGSTKDDGCLVRPIRTFDDRLSSEAQTYLRKAEEEAIARLRQLEE